MKLVLVAVAVLLVVAVGAWIAAEQHYDNCVRAATARTQLALTPAERREVNRLKFDAFDGDDTEEEQQDVEDRPRERRERAVDGCSRLPF